MMYWSSALALLSLHGAGATPTPPKTLFERGDMTFEISDMPAFAPPAELKTAEHILGLHRTNKKPKSSHALHHDRLASPNTPLKAVEDGAGYGVATTLGSEGVFELIFDTGSSDLWVPASKFQCVTPKGKDVAQSKCGFKKTFSGALSSQIPNENFNITYGDGEFVLGTLGKESVTIAGINVPQQEMALAEKSFFEAGGVDGLIGFAYPALTSAYPGTNPNKDNNRNEVIYKNWITNAIAEKKFAPMFSLALERGTHGGKGQVAFGGLPDVKFTHDFATTPLKKVEVNPRPIEKTQFSFYTIIPDGFAVGGKSIATTEPMIVDSGTTLAYLPVKIAEAINAAFDPPSKFIEEEGLFENDCSAKAPKVGVKIGGKTFTISPHDLLPPKSQSYDPNTGGCIVGVQASKGPYILGDTFLRNVVAVFDIGASEMKFAPHENY